MALLRRHPLGQTHARELVDRAPGEGLDGARALVHGQAGRLDGGEAAAAPSALASTADRCPVLSRTGVHHARAVMPAEGTVHAEILQLVTTGVPWRLNARAGSPQAQRIMIARQGDLEAKKKMARTIARIDESLDQ